MILPTKTLHKKNKQISTALIPSQANFGPHARSNFWGVRAPAISLAKAESGHYTEFKLTLKCTVIDHKANKHGSSWKCRARFQDFKTDLFISHLSNRRFTNEENFYGEPFDAY